MNKENDHSITDSCLNTISKYSPFWIIVLSSVFVSFLSFSFVYFFSLGCTDSAEVKLFKSSIIIPLLTTPIIVLIIIRFSKHLRHYQEDIKREIEKNREKDVMLFEQARFVLMGEMMANISHQWKQPLNTIGLSIVSARTSNPSPQELEKHFDVMEDNIHYLATTIDDFMSFFDKRTHLEIRDLSSIIKEIKSIINTHIANNNISLNITVNEELGNAHVASSISQVVLNLLNNAKEAFDSDSKEKNINLKFTTTKHNLKIECCDNGKGIDTQVKDKIFNPYFTTKDKKVGTGIGLYMSKQIVQKLFHGDLYLDTSKSDTCFCIEIPFSDKCIIEEK